MTKEEADRLKRVQFALRLADYYTGQDVRDVLRTAIEDGYYIGLDRATALYGHEFVAEEVKK